VRVSQSRSRSRSFGCCFVAFVLACQRVHRIRQVVVVIVVSQSHSFHRSSSSWLDVSFHKYGTKKFL